MRKKTLLLTLVICLVCITVAYAELKTEESKPVGADFQGTIKTTIDEDGSIPYGYSKWENCSGRWVSEDGKTFEGKTDLFAGRGVELALTKEGELITPIFEGIIRHNETFKSDRGIADRNIVLYGRELLPEGGVFDGSTVFSQDMGEDGMWLRDRRGKIITPTFQGELKQEDKGKEGLRTILEGRELLPDGGFFEGQRSIEYRKEEGYILKKEGKLSTPTFNGTIRLDEYNDYQSKQSNSVETLEGVWTIAPDLKYTGNMLIQRDSNGEVIVQDNRTKVE